MEQTNSNIRKLFYVLAIVATALLTSTINAQSATANFKLEERAILDLKKGINSENPGLKQSSIYLAGKYKVDEAVDDIIKQYNNCSTDSCRLKNLIALSLYQIKSEDAMEHIEYMAGNETNVKVVKTCKAILDLYNVEKSTQLVNN